jgi:hypothetical protein
VNDVPQAGSNTAPRWQSAAAWVAASLAFVVSSAHTGLTSRWYDDLGLVRTLGMWPLGAQGLVSCALAQVTLLLPIANRVFRAGLVANLGAALCAFAFFELLTMTLAHNARTPKLVAVFSFLGSLWLSLGLPMQRGATCAGGASVAVAMALCAILLDRKIAQRRKSTSGLAFVLGCLLMATLSEQCWAALAAAAAIVAARLAARSVMSARETRQLLLGAAVACLTLCVPLLRMRAPHRQVPELPSLSASLAETWAGMAHLSLGGVRFWHDAGVLLAASALGGALWGLSRQVLRPVTLGWIAVLAMASIFGVPENPLRESPTLSLRILAFAACVLFATLTAQTLALALLKVRVSYLGASVIVVATLYAALVAVHADDADYAAESRTFRGNGVFTEEALWTLPRRSLLMLRRRELAYRAWASRLSEGMRPDILVVTPERLQRNPDANRLLAAEPAMAPLVREMVIRGRPTEYALSQLADARPLFVELDPSWDSRLREHIGARGLWSEFHSQTLGRSDRYAVMTATRASVDRVVDVCKSTVPADLATLRVVAVHLKEQATVFAVFGDRAGLFPLLDELEHLGTEPTYVRAARRAAELKLHGPIAWDSMD